MDSLTHAVPVRSARNRLIDLLGIGDTYPLTDLNVVADQLKVPFGSTAKIPIENAQAGVTYELCDPQGQPLGDKFKADGHDGTLVIETPQVSQNVTYRIRATKKPASGMSPQNSRFLDETAPVQVGLDRTLVIEIASYTTPAAPAPVPVPLLDPAIANPRPSDPRIVPFGAFVNVRVNNSQEGVQYSLMLDGKDAGGVAVTGDLAAIILPAGPISEDTVIQVRATKTFLAADNRVPETEPLDATLYLKVSANPALAVSVDSSAIVDYQRAATVTVAGAQRSAKYRAYVHAIRDQEFVRGATADEGIVIVPVAGKPSVQVLKPARSDAWRTPAGYAPTGDSPVPGTGGDLKFTVKALEEDTIVIVQAIKDHQVDSTNPASATIPSAIGLEQAAVVLVRPDPGRALTLRLAVLGAQTGDAMQVSNGQPGVFYYFRQAPAGAEFPLPAYFHKRDDQDTTQNKGVGQLGVQIDFAVATDRDAAPAGRQGDPSGLFPRPPLLNITPVASGSSLSSRAVKAQTAVETPMTIAAQIAAVPAIRPDQAVVDYGGTATILIPASKPGDQYQLMSRGAPVKPAVLGNDTDLSVTTDPLAADALFEVVATRPGDKGMPVERVVQVPIVVRPDATLAVSARQETVDNGAATDIVLQSSQPGVSYQLMSGQDAVGPPVRGSGAAITLPTGPIAAETTFTVVATRTDNAAIAVVIKGQATVKVKA